MVKRELLKFVSNLLLAAMVITSLVVILPSMASADSQVAINSTNFPDSALRKVVESYDGDDDGKLSSDEIEGINYLSVSKVKNMTGIKNLSELVYLSVYDSTISSVDLSSNSKLESIYFDSCNNIEKIDVSSLKNLSYAGVTSCKKFTGFVTSSNNTKLTNVSEVYADAVKSVDLSNLKNLTHFQFYGKNFSYKNSKFANKGKMISMEVSGSAAAKDLVIDLASYKSLKYLTINDGKIDKIDTSKNKKLSGLYLYSNKFQSLNTSKNKKLSSVLLIDNSKLSSVKLNSSINYIGVSDSAKLTKLDFSSYKKLSSLYLSGIKIKSLDLSKNVNLSSISAHNCDKLTSVTVGALKNNCGIFIPKTTSLTLPEATYKSIDSDDFYGITDDDDYYGEDDDGQGTSQTEAAEEESEVVANPVVFSNGFNLNETYYVKGENGVKFTLYYNKQ